MDGVVGMVILANYQKSKHRLAARGLPPAQWWYYCVFGATYSDLSSVSN